MTEILFIAFSLFTIGTAAGVVLARSPIYSAFNLILAFFGLAGLYLLWSSPFIAMVQILIYTGAIVVLFVFVVMLLNLEKAGRYLQSWWMVLPASAATWFMSLLILRVLGSNQQEEGAKAAGLGIREISKLLFTHYLWPFEVLSLFLLALVVGIYVIARPEGMEGEGG